MQTSPFTLEALLVLDAIERRGSFAAAAEQLNKVPSALSYIVQKLEEQLSVTLFVRQGRRSTLTPAGKHLLAEGRKLLTAVSHIAEQTQTIAHGWEPKIRVAVDSILDRTPLFSAFAEFLTRFPTIEIDLSEQVMNGGWEALLDDQVDMLIGAPAPAPKLSGISASPLMEIEQQLFVSAAHPLAGYTQPLTNSDLREFRTVIVHDSARQHIARSTNIIEQSQHFYVDSVEQKVQAISAGLAIGFLPITRVAPLVNAGQLVPIVLTQQQPSIELLIAWKTVNRGKGLQELKALVAEHYR